ncbi:MAG: hypothetical protein KJO82_07035 [Gammaproteobacteria bacterium]|nr:hypothetical protein [Gammaproteobacteria bacterium]
MTASYDKQAAIVLLPAPAPGRITSPSVMRWLAKGRIDRVAIAQHDLARVLAETGRPVPAGGLAALRWWGQRRVRPEGWLTAADPVYLEPQLDKLRLHTLPTLPGTEFEPLMAHLNDSLCQDSRRRFDAVDGFGYLSGGDDFPTATLPPDALEHQVPTEFFPIGEGKARHRQWLSEIEMALHEQQFNLDRQAAGKPPVNSLWLWGGGDAPEQTESGLPALYSDNPLLGGYWRSTSNEPKSWPGNFADCIASSEGTFVAMPQFSAGGIELDELLAELQSHVSSNAIARVVVYFGDMLRIEFKRRDRLRFWQTKNELLRQGFGL